MTSEAVVEEVNDQGSGAEVRDSPVVEVLLNELLCDVVGLESDIQRIEEVFISPEVEEEVLQPAISDPNLGNLGSFDYCSVFVFILLSRLGWDVC